MELLSPDGLYHHPSYHSHKASRTVLSWNQFHCNDFFEDSFTRYNWGDIAFHKDWMWWQQANIQTCFPWGRFQVVSLPTGGGLEGVITTGREEGQKLPCIFETHPPPSPDDTSLSSTGSQLLWSKKYVLITALDPLAISSVLSVSLWHLDLLDLVIIDNVFFLKLIIATKNLMQCMQGKEGLWEAMWPHRIIVRATNPGRCQLCSYSVNITH